MDDPIRIRGARQHNLADIDLDLPRRALTVVTGPSGSGKSSLAFDTLFAEGQRRYVESLSTYAKQFLERMQKPDVDHVEGIAPAVAIEQRNPTRSSRSTVGTATEVYDYLRLLVARVGRTHCPICERRVLPDTVRAIVDTVLALDEGTRIQVTFPLQFGDRIGHGQLVANLKALGYLRLLVEGDPVDLGEPGADDPETSGRDLTEQVEVLVVVDRLVVEPSVRERLADSVDTALREGEGEARIVAADGRRWSFTERFRCPEHPELTFLEPTPRLFSFNNPYGSCRTCTGFGAVLEYDPTLIVPAEERTLDDGAVDPWSKPRYTRERDRLALFARDRGVSVHTSWGRLPEDFRREVLYGAEDFQGVVPFLVSREKKRYKQYIRVFLRQYQTPRRCPECHGARVRAEALRVRVGGRTIAQLSEVPLAELRAWVDDLELEPMESEIAETIVRELSSRLAFLSEVGLGYLTLGRQMRTLSGGEAQRINLASSLGSNLVDTLYILDEPTIGLHPRDTDGMLRLLARLRDGGNTVVVVEHDPAAIRAADHVVELGPAAGDRGGRVVFTGSPEALERADTVTGRSLGGRSAVEVPKRRRRVDLARLELRGARLHNLRGVDLDVPLGALTVVTGVSGSGKSTLVHDILYRALEQELGGGTTSAKQHLGEVVGEYAELVGAHAIGSVVRVDQSPIGRSPRSNPVTYVGAWAEIRRIFSEQRVARERGYAAGHFSFNVEGGRCEECGGAGLVEIEMIFMADVFVPCEACGGSRFRRETLDVRVKGRSIADVLDMSVDEAIRFFIHEDRLGQALWQLQQVGLGYLRLGQPAPTLSGGEAQRLKIARELASAGRKGRRAKGRNAAKRSLYLLDEPTTGLSADDVGTLLRVFDRLLDAGHTVVVIEHNLDVIKVADWVVDLGPGAGEAGGEVVAAGRPEDVASVPESETGRYLAPLLPALDRSA